MFEGLGVFLVGVKQFTEAMVFAVCPWLKPLFYPPIDNELADILYRIQPQETPMLTGLVHDERRDQAE